MAATPPPPGENAGPPLPEVPSDALADLRRIDPDWAARFDGDDPVYALPPKAIDVLANATGRVGVKIFDAPTAAAERAFTQDCEERKIVGLQADGPISYPLLSELPVSIPDFLMALLGWTPTELGVARVVGDLAAPTRPRLRGVVGWLLTDPAFLGELAEVRALYQALPASGRPRFPLARVLQVSDESPPETLVGFDDALLRLLDRWGLKALAAWDLPEPQGPLLPDLLPADAIARPSHGVSVYLPVHYPLQGDDDLQRQIVGFQRQRAAELGIDPGYAKNAHHATYDRMFRVLHLERAVRRRFARPPRGLVGAIEEAAAATLELAPARIQTLRKWIASCRKGNRSRVKDLRVSG